MKRDMNFSYEGIIPPLAGGRMAGRAGQRCEDELDKRQ